MDRLFLSRYRYELRDVVADTHTGHLMVPWLDARALVQESTAWPAHQVGGVKLPDMNSIPQISGRSAIVPSTSNYFHWLTEDLPALVRLSDDPAVDHVLIGKKPPTFVTQAAQLMNISPTVSPRFVRLEVAVLYGKGQDVGWMNPTDVDAVRAFAARVPTKETRAGVGIFIGRRGYSRAHPGEECIQTELAEFGVSPFDPGAHSLIDQIVMFRSSGLVVGLHGAGLAGVAFCRTGSTLLEIVRPGYANRCYEWLCHAFQLPYQAVYDPRDIRRQAEKALGA